MATVPDTAMLPWRGQATPAARVKAVLPAETPAAATVRSIPLAQHRRRTIRLPADWPARERNLDGPCVDIGAHLIAGRDNPAPDTMGQTFDVLAELGVIPHELAVRMKKAVGFRNIAVHNYEAIDWQIAHAIATRNMSDFAAFAAAVVESTGIRD